MTDINNVILVGRITRDIGERDFSYLSTGTAKLNLGLAVNKSVQKNGQWTDDTSFFDVVVWGKLAESLSKRITKGVQVGVSGSLKQDRWKDKNGSNASKVYIVADSVQFLGGQKTAPQNNSNPAQAYPQDLQNEFPEDVPF